MTEIVFKTVHEMRCDLVAHTLVVSDRENGTIGNEVDDLFWTSGQTFPCSAARVSHGKEDKTGEDVEKDIKLLHFLADHNHMTPFEHQSATFLVELPLFVAQEWLRHRTQSFNQISRRYTEVDANLYWIPDTWRKQAKSNRQSSEGAIQGIEEAKCNVTLWNLYQNAYDVYNWLLDTGVCREQARAVLPVGSVTKFYTTANLRNWAHWYKLRIAEDAQYEIRVYAERIGKILSELWPEAWKALTK